MAPSRALRQILRAGTSSFAAPPQCRVLVLSRSSNFSENAGGFRPRVRPSHSGAYRCASTSISPQTATTTTETGAGPEAPDYLSDGERAIFDKVKSALQPTSLEVQDVSGGCGSMYALDIASPKFKGLPVVKQHRMVNDVLGDDIKNMHGIQLRTRVL